jgi:hypothetical protein
MERYAALLFSCLLSEAPGRCATLSMVLSANPNGAAQQGFTD